MAAVHVVTFGGRERSTDRGAGRVGGAEQSGRPLGVTAGHGCARQALQGQGQGHGAYVPRRSRGRQSFGVQGAGPVRVPPQFGPSLCASRDGRKGGRAGFSRCR